MFKRLPFLSQHMKESEKKQIESYMAEKVLAFIASLCCDVDYPVVHKTFFIISAHRHCHIPLIHELLVGE